MLIREIFFVVTFNLLFTKSAIGLNFAPSPAAAVSATSCGSSPPFCTCSGAGAVSRRAADEEWRGEDSASSEGLVLLARRFF